MDNIKEKDILTIVEQCSELRLVGSINGKEEIIEVDRIAKAMLVGYLSKKKLLHKWYYYIKEQQCSFFIIKIKMAIYIKIII